MATIKDKPVEQIIETVDGADLEILLETCDALRQRTKQLQEAKRRLKQMLPPERLNGHALQCGPFRITATHSAGGKEVAFTTKDKYRINVTRNG